MKASPGIGAVPDLEVREAPEYFKALEAATKVAKSQVFPESEAAFYRSMEELLPTFEREGLHVNIDPHPDDFVENGLEALRINRGLDSDASVRHASATGSYS